MEPSKRYLSLGAAVLIWMALLGIALVLVPMHLWPQLTAWNAKWLDSALLIADFAALQLLAWMYIKLPARPQNFAFRWLERGWDHS